MRYCNPKIVSHERKRETERDRDRERDRERERGTVKETADSQYKV